MKVLVSRKISIVFLSILVLASAGVIGLMWYIDVLPVKYMICLIAAALFFLVYGIFSQMTQKTYILGRILIAVFVLLYGGVCYYAYSTLDTLNEISGEQVKLDTVSYIVLRADGAKTLSDTKGYQYGSLENIDKDTSIQALDNVRNVLKQEVAVSQYGDMDSMIAALYSSEVRVIVFNESFRESVEDNHPDFSKNTKVIGSYEIKTNLVKEEDSHEDITEKSFHVYISGIDTYGDISQTSRSDVNIVATVNPVTKQILLTSAPRDFYIPMANSNGVPDKLTHAGMFGVDNSRETLGMLYGIDIDYYVRVNFTGLKKIVNTLGGVEVYSDFDFTSDWGPSFKKGYNKVNGKQALAFCRERHHFQTGDRQRAKNHQYMFQAILSKVMSPSVLPNYMNLLKVFKKMVQTNMSTKQITALAKMQLNDMSQWKISSYSVNGSGARKTTYTYPSRGLYVMIPDTRTVEKAKQKIEKVYNATLE